MINESNPACHDCLPRFASCTKVLNSSVLSATVGRYLDLNRANWDWGVTILGTYNVVGKAFLLILSLLAIVIVRAGVVEYHHKRKDAAVISYVLLVACVFVTALIVAFDHHGHASGTGLGTHSFIDSAYIFSRVLESVAIAPQILLLSRLRGASRVVITYIGALGLYRFLYIVNWAWCVHA